MRQWWMVGAGAAALALGACDQNRPVADAAPASASGATAMLKTSAGADAGRATVTQVAGGLQVTLDATGVPAGVHGVHLHTVGRCDAPDFTSAGGHWNPTAKKHGSMNPQGPHEGDLPNMTVAADGHGTLSATIQGATLAGLMDADGGAIVIHAGPDDLMTDPAGNSGGRIACGVFMAT